MMYNQKALDILKSSINSAIFIDEKAREFFSGAPINNDIPEEKLSVDLFNTFKENGKSLTVHKFNATNHDDDKVLEYLFKGRDLILLDWELAGVAGQEHSLRLLSKAVCTPNINFCCIYSSSNNFNEIPIFLDAYFSGLSKTEFDTIKDTYSHIELKEIQNFLYSTKENTSKFLTENEVDIQSFPIERLRNKEEDIIVRYIYIAIALTEGKFIIPEKEVNEYSVLSAGNDSFIINNTFVLTLKKDLDADIDYNQLLKRISDLIVRNKGSFFQLLGLEMQSVFNSNERFIDETILRSSTEALFQFRNHLNDDKTFGIIIKKLLLEQATLKLRTAKLKLLETDFLDAKSEEIKERAISNDDLFQLNVFYNSVTVTGLKPEDIPNLNFGDVFRGQDDNYYLCITALCDCYEPKKIDYNFYFVEGKVFKDQNIALKIGDTGFLSFLPNNVTIYWGNRDSIQPEKTNKEQGESDEQYRIKKLSSEIEAYKSFLYKPFYIKPKVYNVKNNKILDNKIEITAITNKPVQDLCFKEIEYITTLRNDYTQRIANHAFGHPIRVGVDFVKLK